MGLAPALDVVVSHEVGCARAEVVVLRNDRKIVVVVLGRTR